MHTQLSIQQESDSKLSNRVWVSTQNMAYNEGKSKNSIFTDFLFWRCYE